MNQQYPSVLLEKAEKWYEILKNLENATQEEILSLGNP